MGLFQKVWISGENLSRNFFFLHLGTEGNEGDSTLCKWHGVSQLKMTYQGEFKNESHLNISRGNNERLWSFAVEGKIL